MATWEAGDFQVWRIYLSSTIKCRDQAIVRGIVSSPSALDRDAVKCRKESCVKEYQSGRREKEFAVC